MGAAVAAPAAPSTRPVQSAPAVAAPSVAAPPPADPDAGRPAVRRLAGRFSIKQELERPAAPNAPATVVVDAPGLEPEASEQAAPKAVNPSLLMRVWSDYALERKREGRNSLHATLTARSVEIVGASRLRFAIVNDVQEKYMREEKPTLLGHLRRELNDPVLELLVEKEEVTNLRPRYTVKDRFELLAEKNPALLKLREALDLDLG